MPTAQQETDEYLLPLVQMAPDLVGRMQHGLGALGAYPDGHPVCQRRLAELIEALSGAISRVGEVEFRVIAQELAINDLPLNDKTPGVDGLLEAFRRCGVEAVSFLPEVEPEEIKQVLVALSLEPKEVRDRGGLLGAAPHIVDLPHVRLECISYAPVAGGRAARERKEGLAAAQTVLMQLCAREALFLGSTEFELIAELLQDPAAAAEAIGGAIGGTDEDGDLDPIEIRRRARAVAAGLRRAAEQHAAERWEMLQTQTARCLAALAEDVRDETLRAAMEEAEQDADTLGAIWRSLPEGEAAVVGTDVARRGDAEKISVALGALAGDSGRLEAIMEAIGDRAKDASISEEAQGLVQDVALQILTGLATREGGMQALEANASGLGEAADLLAGVAEGQSASGAPSSRLLADHAAVLGELMSCDDAAALISSDTQMADALSIKLADSIADLARAGSVRAMARVCNHVLTTAPKELARRVRTRLWERRDAIDALLRAFSSADAAERECIADVLTLTGAAAVPGMLDAAVLNGASGLAGTVSRVIARMGPDGLQQVAQQVREGSAEQAAMAVETLARVGGEVAEEAVRYAVRRPEVQVRLAALEAVGHLSVPAASSIALALTDDPEPTVSIGAITRLGELGDDAAIPRLSNIALTRGRKADQERRRAGVAALGRIGSPAATEPLLKVIKSGCFFGRRANDEIRLSAVRALADIGTGEAAAALDAGASATRGRIAAACRDAAARIRMPETVTDAATPEPAAPCGVPL